MDLGIGGWKIRGEELKGEVRKGGFDGIYFNVTLETKQLDFAVQPAVLHCWAIRETENTYPDFPQTVIFFSQIFSIYH